jgi:hypothetical protein
VARTNRKNGPQLRGANRRSLGDRSFRQHERRRRHASRTYHISASRVGGIHRPHEFQRPSGYCETPQELTASLSDAREVVGGFTITAQAESGSTNTGDALKAANAEINSSRHNPDARKVVVLLTDGLATSGGNDPEAHAREMAGLLKETDTEIFTIGLGGSVNEAFLKEISSGDNYYFKALGAGTVDQIYRSVTEALCEDGAAVIEIIPKTRTPFAPLQ